MMTAFRKFVGVRNDMMAYLTMMCIRLLELNRVLKESGSIYLHCDPTASHYLKILMDVMYGKKNFKNEVIWHYRRWSAQTNRFQRLHDVILFYSKTKENVFNTLYEDYTAGTMKRWKGIKRKTTVLSDGSLFQEEDPDGVKGANMGDVWLIPIINANAKERLGYPTQKPEALLARIINASSNEGDLVLDPFCGCGTSVSVAHQLKRRWIGIDITHLAINLIKWRMKNQYGIVPRKDYKVIGEPEDLAGARELAKQNRYQFQWWACSLIDAKPYGDRKKGSDTGIDGFIYFSDEIDKVKKGIVSVKSGTVGVKDVRDLGHVVSREKADVGVLLTLEDPTKPMKTEAVGEGHYKSPTLKGPFPKIQILTIEDIFEGKRPNIPAQLSAIKKAEHNPGENLDLFR